MSRYRHARAQKCAAFEHIPTSTSCLNLDDICHPAHSVNYWKFISFLSVRNQQLVVTQAYFGISSKQLH